MSGAAFGRDRLSLVPCGPNMKKIHAWGARPKELLIALAAFSMTVGTPVHAQDASFLSLSADDVHKAVILATKPHEIILEVTYSRPKQAEFLKASQTGLPKKIKIAFNGQVVAERTITLPLTGHSIKVPLTTLDDAFAQAEGLMDLPAAAPHFPGAMTPGQPAAGPILSVSPGSISKFAVFMYKPDTVWIDITLGDKERAELAELVKKNPGSKIRLALNGKSVGKIETAADKVLTTARVPLSGLNEAKAAAGMILSGNTTANH
jgi:hypothetical protein